MSNIARKTEQGKGPGKPKRWQKSSGHRFPVSNGILEHFHRMGDAIWLFLWLIDRTTKEDVEHGTGFVLGRMPICDEDLAKSLECSTKTIARWRKRLTDGGYITAKNTGHGYSYIVEKSKKFVAKTEKSDQTEVSDQTGQKCPTEPTRSDTTGKSDRTQPVNLKRLNSDHTDKTFVASKTKLRPQDCLQCFGVGFIGDDYDVCPDCNGTGTKPAPQKKAKPNDPRHKLVVDAYATEFESRRGLKPFIDGSDGKQLSTLLRQQSDASTEAIVSWLRNAFDSDDVPPLRPGFRLREFCSHALKFTTGPLKRNSKTPATSKHVGLDKIDHFAGLGPQNENGSYKF